MASWALSVQIQLSSDGVTFADLTSDVSVVTPIDINIGIPSSAVEAHTAQPGTATFYMLNVPIGVYSPGHSDCTAGFEIGKRVFIQADTDYLFNGWIDAINPIPGTLGQRLTKVECSDWIKKAADQKLNLLDVATNVKTETVLATIAGGLATAPIATSYGTGQETFPYALDDCKDEKTTGLAAIDKAAKSEFGWVYSKSDGTLRFDNRHVRLIAPTWKHTFDETEWQSLSVERTVNNIKNWIEVTTSPRTVGGTGETLWSLGSPLAIGAGKTVILKGRYTDPNQQVARISGTTFPVNRTATVNYCLNPSSEVNVTDDWTLAGTGAAVARDTVIYKTGVASAKITAGSATGLLTSVAGVSVPAGATLSISGWSRSDIATKNRIRIKDVTNATTHAPATGTLTNTWEYLTASWTNDTGLAATCQFANVNLATDSATLCWFDACQLELASSANAYCDGSLGTGYSWDGTANNSVSRCTQSPVAGVDFNFSSGQADTGDLNSSLGISVDYGANEAQFTLTNSSSGTGYVTTLKVIGKAIRMFDPTVSQATDSDTIVTYDKHLFQFDMPWQSSALTGQAIADAMLSVFKVPQTIATSITYVPDTQALMDLAKGIVLGDGIKITSPVNGLNAMGFFVNAIHWSIKKNNNVTVTYTLGWSFVGAYWMLGVAGASELGQTTILAF